MKTLLAAIFALVCSLGNASQVFVSASSQGLLGGSLMTARPCTISMWVYLDAGSVFDILWMTAISDGSSQCYFLINRASTLEVLMKDGVRSVTSSNQMSVGSWNHIVGVFNSDTSRAIYLNGVKTTAAADTLTFNFGAAVRTTLGYYDATGSVPSDYMDGKIADVRTWSSLALSDADVAALYAGAPFFMVRPFFLLTCFPLTGTLNSRLSSNTLTNINSSTVSSTSPRIYR